MRTLRLLFLVGLATGFISEKLFVSSQSSLTTADDLYLEGRTSGDLPIDDEDGDDDGSGSGSGSGDYPLFDLTEKEEILRRFRNFTTVPKENVTVRPQPTAGSTHKPSTTAAESQERPTTAEDKETTPIVIPNGDSKDLEVPTAETEVTHRPSTTSTDMTPRETTTAQSGKDLPETKDPDEDNSLDRWGVSPTKDGENKVVVTEMDNEIVAIDGRGSRMYDMEAPQEVTSENMWERTDVLAAVIACGVVGFLCAVFLLLLLAYRMKKKDEGSYDLGDTKISSTTYHKAPTKEFYA